MVWRWWSLKFLTIVSFDRQDALENGDEFYLYNGHTWSLFRCAPTHSLCSQSSILHSCRFHEFPERVMGFAWDRVEIPLIGKAGHIFMSDWAYIINSSACIF